MLHVWGDLARGIGSDTAILDVPAGTQLVSSVDSSIENVHFRREWLSAAQIGYRAAAAALSDLAAAAADPVGVLVALNVPHGWIEEVPGIAQGIGEAVRESGAHILGGDTASASQLSITVTVFGSAARPLTRNGSRAGDRIFLTGDVGRSASALAKLERGEAPSPEEMDRFARPTPRIRESIWLASRGAVAAIDVSDGLVSELTHLAAAGNTRLRIQLENIPCVKSGVDQLAAISSGEEYELLVAMPASFEVNDFRSSFSTRITEIGLVMPGPAGVEILSHGSAITLPGRGGHDHF
jgi:thiamine-monophosphate kinase